MNESVALRVEGVPEGILIDVSVNGRLKSMSHVLMDTLHVGRYHAEDGHVRVKLDPTSPKVSEGSTSAALIDLISRPPRDHRVEFITADRTDLRLRNLRNVPVVRKGAA